MPNRFDLTRVLFERQADSGESDADFARRLGMSRQMLQALRSGAYRPGVRSLHGILTAYPDLGPEVTAFLVASETSISV